MDKKVINFAPGPAKLPEEVNVFFYPIEICFVYILHIRNMATLLGKRFLIWETSQIPNMANLRCVWFYHLL